MNEPELEVVDIIAGYQPDGDPVLERLNCVRVKDGYALAEAPLFAAAGRLDVIQLNGDKGGYQVVTRSGNLTIRFVSKHPTSVVLDEYRVEFEKMGAEISNVSDRFFSITAHVSLGFNNIEELLGDAVKTFPNSAWAYTNVFDSDSGEPLQWWSSMLKEQ